jgi:hypothetical protein
MRRLCAIALLAAAAWGCGDTDGDDVAEIKKPVSLDKLPPAVMKAARTAAPGYTFFVAYEDTYQGQESYEIKGKDKQGKVLELEVSRDGSKVLGRE